MPPLALRPDGILDPQGRYPNPFTGEPYSEIYKKKAIDMKNGENKGWSGYRTWVDHPEIFHKIHKYQIMLLIAPTGVGKTVVVPKLFMHYFGYKVPVICTTPRQKTTQSAADFASFLLDVPNTKKDPVTNEVIWEREKDWYVGAKWGDMPKPMEDDKTRLLFTTDGSIRVYMMKKNPDLIGYGGLIIDEAHERSVSIDILIGLVVDLCNRRPDFKVIIMSATVNPQVFINYFKGLGVMDKFTIYNPEGVPGNYESIPKYLKEDVPEEKTVERLGVELDLFLKNNEEMDKIMGPGNVDVKGKRFMLYGRDILAFVSSASECGKLKTMIDANWAKGMYKYRPYTIVFTKDTGPPNSLIATKENGMSLITDGQKYDFKLIISTPVAESSITFEDPMAHVFETGLTYFSQFDPLGYGTRGYKGFVTRANITQRCGRTGRTNNGYCHKMYSEHQWLDVMQAFPDPEIMHVDLTEDLLGLCMLPSIGNVPKTLEFLGKMPEPLVNYKDIIKCGFRNLLDYDCVDMAGNVTPLGRLCSSFGRMNYNIVRLICFGYYVGVLREVIYLAGILGSVRSFNDMFYAPPGMEDDPALEAKFSAILEYFAHPSGEHLSLLNLYLQWAAVPEYQRVYWERHYSIDGKKMNSITNSIKTVTESVIGNLNEIRKLNLIKVYKSAGDAAGTDGKKPMTGGGGWFSIGSLMPKDITHEFVLGGAGDLLGGGLATRDPSIPSSGKWNWDGGCAGAECMRMSIKENIHTCRGSSPFAVTKHMMTGGAPQGGKPGPQGGKPGPQGGKPPFGGKPGAPGGKPKLTKEEWAEINKKKAALEARQKQLRELIEMPEMNMRGMFANTETQPVDLGDVQSMPLAERMLMSIYFAYHTHMGVYEGEPGSTSNKYLIKYSNQKGNIKDTSLASISKNKPPFIVFHDFALSDRDNVPSICSQLPQKIINVFVKAHKAKK